jgi:hypothetical protein
MGQSCSTNGEKRNAHRILIKSEEVIYVTGNYLNVS